MAVSKKLLGYWFATGIFCLVMLAGGIFDLLRAEQAVAVMTHLGYPHYVSVILGAWKVLGAAALLAPGLGRLKEWAYAGFTFDLTGAVASHLWVGDPVNEVVGPLIFLGVMFTSYRLRPHSRR